MLRTIKSLVGVDRAVHNSPPPLDDVGSDVAHMLDEKDPVAVKHDDAKDTFDLLPFDALAEIQKVLDFGADKYGAYNWEKGFKWLRLANAAARHLFAWMRGANSDSETGRSHLAHLGCCVLFLLAHELRGIGEDDRRLGPTGYGNSVPGVRRVPRAVAEENPSD